MPAVLEGMAKEKRTGKERRFKVLQLISPMLTRHRVLPARTHACPSLPV